MGKIFCLEIASPISYSSSVAAFPPPPKKKNSALQKSTVCEMACDATRTARGKLVGHFFL